MISLSKALLQEKERTSMWKDLKNITEENGTNYGGTFLKMINRVWERWDIEILFIILFWNAISWEIIKFMLI